MAKRWILLAVAVCLLIALGLALPSPSSGPDTLLPG